MTAPGNSSAMFIGWAETPPADRRFFLRAGLALSTAADALRFGLAALERQADRLWRASTVVHDET